MYVVLIIILLVAPMLATCNGSLLGINQSYIIMRNAHLFCQINVLLLILLLHSI